MHIVIAYLENDSVPWNKEWNKDFVVEWQSKVKQES